MMEKNKKIIAIFVFILFFAFLFLSVSSYAITSAELNDGLIAYYKLDEKSGTLVEDSLGVMTNIYKG